MSTQKSDKELAEFNKLLEREKARVAIEKYSYKELGWGWLTIPALIMIVGGILAYVQAKSTSQVDSTFASIFIIDIIVFSSISHYNEKWKKKLEAKNEIKYKDDSYKFTDYTDGYIYTDSSFEKGFYILSKIICYLIGIAGIGLLSVLAFSWLGSITIAPTTIIIILLIVIIHNQEKGN